MNNPIKDGPLFSSEEQDDAELLAPDEREPEVEDKNLHPFWD